MNRGTGFKRGKFDSLARAEPQHFITEKEIGTLVEPVDGGRSKPKLPTQQSAGIFGGNAGCRKIGGGTGQRLGIVPLTQPLQKRRQQRLLLGAAPQCGSAAALGGRSVHHPKIERHLFCRLRCNVQGANRPQKIACRCQSSIPCNAAAGIGNIKPLGWGGKRRVQHKLLPQGALRSDDRQFGAAGIQFLPFAGGKKSCRFSDSGEHALIDAEDENRTGRLQAHPVAFRQKDMIDSIGHAAQINAGKRQPEQVAPLPCRKSFPGVKIAHQVQHIDNAVPLAVDCFPLRHLAAGSQVGQCIGGGNIAVHRRGKADTVSASQRLPQYLQRLHNYPAGSLNFGKLCSIVLCRSVG